MGTTPNRVDAFVARSAHREHLLGCQSIELFVRTLIRRTSSRTPPNSCRRRDIIASKGDAAYSCGAGSGLTSGAGSSPLLLTAAISAAG